MHISRQGPIMLHKIFFEKKFQHDLINKFKKPNQSFYPASILAIDLAAELCLWTKNAKAVTIIFRPTQFSSMSVFIMLHNTC